MKNANTAEIELFDLKWFDYRALHPDVATMVFFQEYIRSAREYNVRLGYSKYVNVLKGYPSLDLEGLKRHSHWGMLTKLRRYADRHGIEYYFFWKWASEAHLQLCFARRFLNVYLAQRILAKVLEYRDEHVNCFIIYSQLQVFEAQNYKGWEVQDDYYSYVVKQLKKRNSLKDFTDKIKKLVSDGKIPLAFFKKLR